MRAITASSRRLKGCAQFERLSPLFCSLAERVPPRRAFVEINWIGERKMAFLNRMHKGRRGAAEVLTFHYDCPPDDARESPVGEIYLCWSQLRRGAERRGVSRRAYAARLVVHGLFHLRGYRHDTDASEARMEEAEKKFLRREFAQRVLERLFA